MTILKDYKFMSIVLALREINGKTAYKVLNKNLKDTLGKINYYPKWKQFVFEPEPFSTFSHDCLADIQDFLKNHAGK